MPLFLRDALSAVMVFFCGDPGTCAGAIELWHPDPRVSLDKTLVDEYCGPIEPLFEPASQGTDLACGAAVSMNKLGARHQGPRTGRASDVGTNSKLSFPCTTPNHGIFVVTFLAG